MTSMFCRRTAALASALALAALSAGCGVAGHAAVSATPEPPEKPDITVAVVPAVDSAGFFIALQRGLFAAQGLHVKYVPALSSQYVIAQQESGQYDITGGNYVSYIQAEAADPSAGLQIIAAGSTMETGSQAVYVMPNSNVSTIPQLRGETIAVNASDGIASMLVDSVLAEYQIPADAVQLKVVNFPDMGTALSSGQAQAAEIPEPFASEYADSLGLVQLFDANQGATQNLPILGYVATKSWIRKYPRTMAAFLRALEQGQQLASTNRADVDEAMEHYSGVDGVTAGVMALNGYPLTISQPQLQRVPDLMQLYGLLNKPFNIDTMLTNPGADG